MSYINTTIVQFNGNVSWWKDNQSITLMYLDLIDPPCCLSGLKISVTVYCSVYFSLMQGGYKINWEDT